MRSALPALLVALLVAPVVLAEPTASYTHNGRISQSLPVVHYAEVVSVDIPMGTTVEAVLTWDDPLADAQLHAWWIPDCITLECTGDHFEEETDDLCDDHSRERLFTSPQTLVIEGRDDGFYRIYIDSDFAPQGLDYRLVLTSSDGTFEVTGAERSGPLISGSAICHV